MSSTDEIIPDDQEKYAMKQFCELQLQLKSIKKPLETTKALQSHRRELLQKLKRNNASMYALEGNVPSYIRLVKNSSDKSISTKHIVETLRPLSVSLVNNESYKDILKTVWISQLRSSIRKQTDQIKLTNTPQRGLEEVHKAPLDIQQQCEKFCTLQEEHTNQAEYKKYKSKEIQEKLLQPTATVESFLDKSATLLQRVTVENKQYNITKKQTIKKPKVTISMVEKFLVSILEDAPSILTPQTYKQFELQLCSRVQSVPPSISTKTILASLPNYHPHVV